MQIKNNRLSDLVEEAKDRLDTGVYLCVCVRERERMRKIALILVCVSVCV